MFSVNEHLGNETVQRMLDAAEILFLEHHYADVSVSQVAEAAALTKGAVYHYFPSKEQLYLAMLHRDLASKRELYRNVAVAVDATAAERLRRLTGAFLDLPGNKRRLIGLVRRDVNVFPPTLRDELVRAYQDALPNQVEVIVRDGIRAGELVPGDARLMAWQFVALVEVLLTPYATQRFASEEDTAGYVVSVFLHGCARYRSEVHP